MTTRTVMMHGMSSATGSSTVATYPDSNERYPDPIAVFVV
jgi:hypothetical protein